MPQDPISTECSNPGFGNRWTCPGCYADLDGAVKGKSVACSECGSIVMCTLDYDPVCRSRIVGADEIDDEEEVA